MTYKKLTPKKIIEIQNFFSSEISRIFGSNLSFAFICGSFAKGRLRGNSDIDLFVCTKEAFAEQIVSFRRFYFDFHKKYNFKADYVDPGEIMTIEELKKSLDKLKTKNTKRVIETYDIYEALVWRDMLAGLITAETGDINSLKAFVERANSDSRIWRKFLLDVVNEESGYSNLTFFDRCDNAYLASLALEFQQVVNPKIHGDKKIEDIKKYNQVGNDLNYG